MNLKKILPFFSYLFHPIFIPVGSGLLFFFLYNTNLETDEKYYVLLQITVITIVLPILSFLFLRAFGKVDSVMMFEINQRKVPLAILCFLTILLMKKSITLERFPEFHFFFLGGLLSTILALLLLFFQTKASLHMLTISAFTLFFIGLNIHNQKQNTILIIFLMISNGLVAWSRLEMKAHTPKELAIGFILGVIPQLLMWRFWL
jgi:membrane-associated phospholipid phosphatase